MTFKQTRKWGTGTWEMMINQPDSKKDMQSIFNAEVKNVIHIKSITPFKHQKGYKKDFLGAKQQDVVYNGYFLNKRKILHTCEKQQGAPRFLHLSDYLPPA